MSMGLFNYLKTKKKTENLSKKRIVIVNNGYISDVKYDRQIK